ncbi:hypothetical protein V6N12_007705 [Hibiscus sabdariffa]|uniref:Uncharacterized protein n=1 Tax=Hibiscus sabdariffa TaxID=183260 RepID=A0ABR2F2L7_9ROSI
MVFTYYNMRLKMRHHQRTSNDAINTSYNPINLDHIFEDVDPISEWLQEKENPLLDGENVDMFPADSSDDEINVIDQSEEQNLFDSSSSATPTQSGGDGQDSGTGGLSPIYDDDRESGDRGEIRSSRRHGEEYGIGSVGAHFCHMSKFGENMSATPTGSGERSESRA